MRRQVGIWRELVLLGIALCCACDGKKPAPGVSESWDNVCVDMDKDGYGFQCESGSDCDDANPAAYDDCSNCKTPAQGCECEDGIEPIDCRLPYTMDSSGSLLCHTGTRYCRDGAWSGCEGVVTFTVAPPARQLRSALIDPDAPPIPCNEDCDPGCHLVEDKLDTPFAADAGVGTHVNSADAGGVTVSLTTPGSNFVEELDTTTCEMDDSDCDGLPSPYDPDPMLASGGGNHKVAFYDLAPGTERTKTFQARARAEALDVYLYPGTGSGMAAALPVLASALTSGSFLPNGGAGEPCLDNDGDAMPDETNKSAGIAGNLACFVRDVRFGAGWFREVPFYGDYPYYFGPWDSEMYDHAVDISSDLAAVRTALDDFRERDSFDEPEAAIQGLWSIATGQGYYPGWDRPGLPARSCPARSFGYPCFRDEALASVLIVSPAPMHNGPIVQDGVTHPACLGPNSSVFGAPDCVPLNYPDTALHHLTSGTGAVYKLLTTGAESRSDPEPVGAIDDVLVTYIGDVGRLRADHSYADLPMGTCRAWSTLDNGGHDAVFRFRVNNTDDYFFSGSGSRFDNTLALFRVGAGGVLSLVHCSDNDVDRRVGDLGWAPEMALSLEGGEYLLVMKAKNAAASKGMFQVTMGRRELEQPGTFAAKLWAGTGGVEQALRAEGVRVAALQLGTNPYLTNQAVQVAEATGAVDALGVALRGQVQAVDAMGNPDFSQLGPEAVRVLRGIVDGTRFDVSLDVAAFALENPGFGLLVEAIDEVGSGCQGVADSDSDGVADFHQQCVASARPRFRVTLRNPGGSAAVPRSTEPGGGYFMWMRVLGDQRVLLDRVRMYVLPEQVYTEMITPRYHATGAYEQEVRANACADDELPAWGALSWNATLPAQTSIRFEACASDTSEGLKNCELKELLTLTPGDTGCTPGTACAEAAYCDADQTCVEVQGASCTEDVDCGAFGICAGSAGAKRCGNVKQTLDTYPVARSALQGRRFLRVSVRLNSSPDYAQAPTLLEWSINYRCAPGG